MWNCERILEKNKREKLLKISSCGEKSADLKKNNLEKLAQLKLPQEDTDILEVGLPEVL